MNWSDLEAANRAEMLAYFGTSSMVQRHLSDELGWVITGIESNDGNGVAWCRLAEANADAVITTTLQQFSNSNLPFLWLVQADSHPADLGQRLEAHGCKLMDGGVCMGADLNDLPETPGDMPGLVIERVQDEAGLADWLDVWMTLDDGIREPRQRLYASLGFAQTAALRHYLARLNARPVATAQIFLGRETAGLYCVSVLPELRRKGIGRAVVSAALRDAKALGHRWSVLGPTSESVHLYEQLGFKLYPCSSHEYYLPWG
jgi:GNAT superfamily N-acetyltransferase